MPSLSSIVRNYTPPPLTIERPIEHPEAVAISKIFVHRTWKKYKSGDRAKVMRMTIPRKVMRAAGMDLEGETDVVVEGYRDGSIRVYRAEGAGSGPTEEERRI